MLAYLDRLPQDLPLAPRIALMAIRLWARDIQAGRCPLGMMRGLFDRFGVRGALWPAHNFLYWVTAHSARPMQLGCPCCGRVSDDEAQLLAGILAREEGAVRAALRPLVTDIATNGAARLARSFGAELLQAAEVGGPAVSE